MKLSVLGSMMVLIAVPATADPPDTAWVRVYGGPAADAGQTGQLTNDGGYVFVGTTWSFGAGNADIWLLKLNAAGDTEWSRTYGGTGSDFGYGVRQTRDSGYAIAGWTNSFGITDTNAYLVRTNPRGETLWTRTFGGAAHDRAWTLAELYDGGFAITGWSHSYGGLPYGHVFAARCAANGDSTWVRVYGGEYSDFGISIQQTVDTALVIAGYYGTGPGLRVDGYLLKLDMNGDTLWTRRYGGSQNDGWSWVEPTSDRGFILAGATYSFGAGMADVWLTKTDSLGVPQWTKLYGWPRDDGSRGATPCADGGFIVAGQCDAQGWETSDLWVLRTDANGDTVWTWTYGEAAEWDKVFLAHETPDGGCVVFGETESYGAADRDFIIIRFEPDAGSRESPGQPSARVVPKATIVRSSLVLSREPSSPGLRPPSPSDGEGRGEDADSRQPVVLLDAAGRKVLELAPGANDVRHLSPGVYFVRSGLSAVSRQPSAVQKVVVTR